MADEQTLEYFAALSCGIDSWTGGPGMWMCRSVSSPSHRRKARMIASWSLSSVLGSEIGPHDASPRPMAGFTPGWRADAQPRCARATARRSKSARSVPSSRAGSEFTGLALADWLLAQAGERGIDVHPASPLQRIVFEGGRVVGERFSPPPMAPIAVRARHGVSVAPGGPQVTTAIRNELLGGDGTVRLCLVGRAASRFGRLELLTTDPSCAPTRSVAVP